MDLGAVTRGLFSCYRTPRLAAARSWARPEECCPDPGGSRLDTGMREPDRSGSGLSSGSGSREKVATRSPCEEALLRKDQHGSVPSVRFYTELLRGCARGRALGQAKLVQAHMVKDGWGSNEFLRELVVDTLVKCGSLDDALSVFNGLEHRTAFSWTAIISGYCQGGQERVALRLYWRMQEQHVRPNKYTLLCLLKACGSLADLEEGQGIHAELVRHGLDADLFLSTALLDMYGKCGSIVDARHVFDTLPRRDVVSWNAMIGGYAEQDQGEKALELYGQMREGGVSPDDRTFVSALKAISCVAGKEEGLSSDGPPLRLDLLGTGKFIHAEAAFRGYMFDVFVASSLISMYAKCGSIRDAHCMFEALPECSVVSWNALIAGYAEQDQGDQAVQLYHQMRESGVSPTDRTFVAVLKACGSLAAKEEGMLAIEQSVKEDVLQLGKWMHVELVQRGYHSDPFVGNTLAYMYARCGSMSDARHVFDNLPERNVVSWNSIIAGYGDQGQGETALQLYGEMQEEGVTPDRRTFVSVIKACGSFAGGKRMSVAGQFIQVEVMEKVKVIHAEVAYMGYESDVFVGSCLISLYVACGEIEDARRVFDTVSNRDIVSWSAMIAGYAQQEQPEQALQLYKQMQAEGFKSDLVIFLCILETCSNAGALNLCKQLHQEVINSGYGCNPKVVTALIDAYGKCGSMVDAQTVFDSLSQHDAWSSTSLVAGYARHGDCEKSLQCYQDMCRAGIKPDEVTFIPLLSACSHAGLVHQGLDHFESMSRVHGISPTVDHYACMVDLLGRAGLFSEIEDLLQQMPMQPDFALWSSLLGACRKHGNTVMGRLAFDHLVQIDPKQASPYVLMSTIYVQAGMWECAQEVENLRCQLGAWKRVGQTWIEHEQEVAAFAVGDRKHHQSKQLYSILEELTLPAHMGGRA